MIRSYFTNIVKIFILPDRQINFTGMTDSRDSNYLILESYTIYNNGKREISTLHLTHQEVNDLFDSLEN